MSEDLLTDDLSKMAFNRMSLDRISTGSNCFDQLLKGGLPVACITDVYGASGTGKTQFAFQNAIMTCEYMRRSQKNVPHVLFIDCSGSFRPERIAEISHSRSLDPGKILDAVYSISVRNVIDQCKASQRVESESTFANCRLLIIDDATSNFVSEFEREEDIASRQSALSSYARHLSYVANKRGISVLLTNSVRSRGEMGEGETTGEVLAAFSLYRLHFSRRDRQRLATLIQPDLSGRSVSFEIGTSGIG